MRKWKYNGAETVDDVNTGKHHLQCLNIAVSPNVPIQGTQIPQRWVIKAQVEGGHQENGPSHKETLDAECAGLCLQAAFPWGRLQSNINGYIILR